jgi:hypothetical protein
VLAGVRVLQRNLLYVVGLAPSIAREEVLKKREYFGRFGRIVKVAVNRKQVHGADKLASYSAYVTYKSAKDAADANKAMTGLQVDGRTVRCTFGTTKYCSCFLRNTACNNSSCLYLHEMAAAEDSFSKEDLQMNERFSVALPPQLTSSVSGGLPSLDSTSAAPLSRSASLPAAVAGMSKAKAGPSGASAAAAAAAAAAALPAVEDSPDFSAEPSPEHSPVMKSTPFSLDSEHYPPLGGSAAADGPPAAVCIPLLPPGLTHNLRAFRRDPSRSLRRSPRKRTFLRCPLRVLRAPRVLLHPAVRLLHPKVPTSRWMFV